MSISLSNIGRICVPDNLVRQLDSLLIDIDTNNLTSITFNFRDPEYSPNSGGFHPVEIRLMKDNGKWLIDYFTDFSYAGAYAELEKEVDILFQEGTVYLAFFGTLKNHLATELAKTTISNFISYYNMDVYQTQISTD
ncbi:hypothetical protein PS1M3_03760 [Pseudoalteromonas sp. PS1M3]|nr:hypothetical protein PS1M3_03760 [Pseudoalteromonas sp. PS1M3]